MGEMLKMKIWKKFNLSMDDTMRNISTQTAIQTCIRRACLIAREFTGIEVMPEEMGSGCVDTLGVLKHAWENFTIVKNKPDSVVNYAACMAVMEWCMAVKKEKDVPYKLNSDAIAASMDFIGKQLEDLFPGLMSSKNALQGLYDGICATCDNVEKHGWQWTKKLNDRFACLMSMYPSLRAIGKRNSKLAEIADALKVKGVDDV